jgi:hypothetical protein
VNKWTLTGGKKVNEQVSLGRLNPRCRPNRLDRDGRRLEPGKYQLDGAAIEQGPHLPQRRAGDAQPLQAPLFAAKALLVRNNPATFTAFVRPSTLNGQALASRAAVRTIHW